MEKDKTLEEPNMCVFDTHKFLFTLNYEEKAKGHTITFENRDNQMQEIELQSIEIQIPDCNDSSTSFDSDDNSLATYSEILRDQNSTV